MWAKLVEIVETKWNTNQQPRNRLAKTVNILYGAMNNCQFAFTRYENAQTALNFTNFVFALDALISTLRNVNSQVAIFDPELTELWNDTCWRRPEWRPWHSLANGSRRSSACSEDSCTR